MVDQPRLGRGPIPTNDRLDGDAMPSPCCLAGHDEGLEPEQRRRRSRPPRLLARVRLPHRELPHAEAEEVEARWLPVLLTQGVSYSSLARFQFQPQLSQP